MEIPGRYVPINGYPGYYITDTGDVYSDRLRNREKEPKLRKMTIAYPRNPLKYPNVKLCTDHGIDTKMIHRLVAEHFVDGYFIGAVVNHIDGDTRNNDYTNLEWVTQCDNIHKSYETSGVDQTRNFFMWRLIDPDGNNLGLFKGFPELSCFIEQNNLHTSVSSLSRNHVSKGYKVEKFGKEYSEAVTTIQ